jgi:phosphopantothenoylcysteine decarboxylase
MKILLGVTGSVAATLAPKMVATFKEAGHEVRLVATDRAVYFFDPKEVGEKVWRDKDEWSEDGYHKNDPVPHIDFHKWADVFVIAPLTADTLADIAIGKADKFLACIARAWPKDKPFIIAPAMNTHMWQHPITAEQLGKIATWFPNFKVVEPIKKRLACGDIGEGAMADIATILSTIEASHT